MQVNFGSRSGQTPLHWAAARNSLEAALLLLASGAQIDAVDQDGTTPLLAAISRGNKFMVLLLIEFGASLVHTDANGSSCMHLAAGVAGDVDMLRLLSRRGAVATAEDGQDMLPIHRACASGKFDAAIFLVEELGCSASAPLAAGHKLADGDALAAMGYAPGQRNLLPLDLAIMDIYKRTTQGEGSASIGPVRIPPPAVSLAQVSSIGQSLGRCLQFLRNGGAPVADPYFWRLRAIPHCPSAVWKLRTLTLGSLLGPVALPFASGLSAGDTIPKLQRFDLIMEASAHYTFGVFGSEAPNSNWQVRHLPFAAWVLLVAVVIANLGMNDMQGPMRSSWMVPMEAFLFGVVLLAEAVILVVDPGTVDPYAVGWAEGEVHWQALPRGGDLVAVALSKQGKLLHGAVSHDGHLLDPVSGHMDASSKVGAGHPLLMVDPHRIQVLPDGLTTVNTTAPKQQSSDGFMIVQVTPVDDSPTCVAAAQLANAMLAMGVAQGIAGFNWHNPASNLSSRPFIAEEFVPKTASNRMVVVDSAGDAGAVCRRMQGGAHAPATVQFDYQAITQPTVSTTWSTTCQFLLQRKLSHIERLLLDSTFASGVSAELRDEMTCFTTECVQPPRSKFDTVTQRRYHKFDHFCPWVHRAVAANTHPWFVLYCVAQFLCCVLGVALWMLPLWHIPHASQMSWPMFIWRATAGRGFISLLSLLCHSFGTALCAGLLGFHVPHALAGNVTTNEASNANRYAHMWRFSPPDAVAKAQQFLAVSRQLQGPNADAQMLAMLKALPYFKREVYSPFAWDTIKENAQEMLGLRAARRVPPGRVRHLKVTAEALGAVATQVANHTPKPTACGSGCSHDHGHSASAHGAHDGSPSGGAAAPQLTVAGTQGV